MKAGVLHAREDIRYEEVETPVPKAVEARLGDTVIGTGAGHSKKAAEQHAAFEAIKRHKK